MRICDSLLRRTKDEKWQQSLPHWLSCSDGANISAEVLQLNSNMQIWACSPFQNKWKTTQVLQFVVSFVAVWFQHCCFCVLAPWNVLCERCTPWTCPETDTCESLCATTRSLLGCWPSSSLQVITTGFISAGTPHTCTRSWLWMVTEPPEHFCSVSPRFPSLAVPQCVSACGIAQVLWVGEAVSMILCQRFKSISVC